MRILLVHEYYREWGGEDVAFETDAGLLESAGHDVHRLTFHNSDISEQLSILDRMRLFASTVWSRDAARQVASAISVYRPDVVHFHNTFPLISPAAFVAASRMGVPVVATLHNYRLVCPNALLFRAGRICEDCITAPLPLPAILHACYRDSLSQSVAAAGVLMFHRLRRTFVDHVSLFITPSAFLRSKLIEGGLPASKLFVRTNSVAPSALRAAPGSREGFLFAGRLVPSKGVQTVLEAWNGGEGMPRLAIAGAGEMEPLVRAAAEQGQIDYLGPLASSDVFAAMNRAMALVVPSTWFETQGLSVIEAFSHGLPVIASKIGALPEAVRDGETGLLVSPGDARELAEAVTWASKNPSAMAAMGEQALSVFAERYAPEPSLSRLVELYESLASRRRTGRGRRQAASLT